MPINLTNDLSKEVNKVLRDDLIKPNGIRNKQFIPAKVNAFQPYVYGGRGKTIRGDGGDSNFAGDNILEHSDRNIISPG